MFPSEHCEKVISPDEATGLIKNFALASQAVVVSGQQELVSLHPSAHYEPKLLATIMLVDVIQHVHHAVRLADMRAFVREQLRQDENRRTIAPKLWPIS